MSDDVPDEMTDEGFTGDPAEGEIEDGGPEEPFGEGEVDAKEAEDENSSKKPGGDGDTINLDQVIREENKVTEKETRG